jgi:hypothetical protein
VVIQSPAVVVACSQDPTFASAANAAALLFFPPALSLVHPVLYLPASVLVRPQLLLEEPRWRSPPLPAPVLSPSTLPYLSSPPPSSLVVDCNVFSITSHSNRLVIDVVVLHPTAIPALEEPSVHATVAHGPRAEMPTRGRMRQGVGVSIHLAKGVSPRDLSRGRMFCWRRRKNTMIKYFYGCAR